MEILKLLGTVKQGKSTTEFLVMIIGGLFAGGMSTGLIDWLKPEEAEMVAQNVGKAVETIQAVKSGDLTIADALIRIVALIVGGQILSAYIKSRGDTKSAHVMAIAQSIAAERLKLEKSNPEVLNESDSDEIPIKPDRGQG